jgi:hypothetical protein
MSAKGMCWGIFREASHSPGRVDDDRGILRAVGKALEERGFAVTLCVPEESDKVLATPSPRIFAMCEGPEIISALRVAEANGAVIVNAPGAVRKTDRHQLIEEFDRAAVRSPRARVVTIAGAEAPELPVWVKRSDHHATEADDVIFVDTPKAWRKAMDRFAARGFDKVVTQGHVEGDLVKFYGVRRQVGHEPSWFVWFYHRDQKLANHVFDENELEREAAAAAEAIGLEVFGGDAIVGPNGRPMIIDLNAWPSFALYRKPAAIAIAEHLAAKFASQPAEVVS